MIDWDLKRLYQWGTAPRNHANNNVVRRKGVENLFGLVGPEEVEYQKGGPVLQDRNKLLIQPLDHVGWVGVGFGVEFHNDPGVIGRLFGKYCCPNPHSTKEY